MPYSLKRLEPTLTNYPLFLSVGDTQQVLPHGRRLEELAEDHGNPNVRVRDDAIQIVDLGRLETLVVDTA